uniref:Uncharacterized protein n=1 Tax=Vespula pensylvanica TaxID=30213 RepID=A0A834N1B9_VESPE|nr:hypothetical protein H0235_017735 [Vespula pensylvanica]
MATLLPISPPHAAGVPLPPPLPLQLPPPPPPPEPTPFSDPRDAEQPPPLLAIILRVLRVDDDDDDDDDDDIFYDLYEGSVKGEIKLVLFHLFNGDVLNPFRSGSGRK